MKTVQDVIATSAHGTCSTGAVRGLSLQIIAEMNLLVPHALVSCDDLPVDIDSAAVNPFLQPAAKEALRRAIRARGVPLKITSAYRTIAQQFVLWSWFKQGKRCGITLAATPGKSNHEDGLALDIPDFEAWRPALEQEHWDWLGARDPVHFTYRGVGVRDDIGDIGLKAFQSLWNKQNPNDQITVDGLFGPNTAGRLVASPAEGFSTPRILKLTEPFMAGEDIRQVQAVLVTLGLLPSSEVDGVFGPKTEAAVQEFQEERGLNPDGIVSPQTRRELGSPLPTEEEDTDNMPQGTPTPLPADRWRQALAKAPTTGASAATAQQDGLPPGVASSQKMAQTDASRVFAVADRFRQVGAQFHVPPALIAALASRESRCGNVLDARGFGDRGHAFGILQVDKRFHTLQGTESPTALAHIAQAVGIFATFRQQVQAKHPDWEDAFVLKGAAVAYNSGVSNVQTKKGMDIGTTGNDYGSDVIARAQFYATRPELA